MKENKESVPRKEQCWEVGGPGHIQVLAPRVPETAAALDLPRGSAPQAMPQVPSNKVPSFINRDLGGFLYL